MKHMVPFKQQAFQERPCLFCLYSDSSTANIFHIMAKKKTKTGPELQPDNKKAKIAIAFLRGQILRDSAKTYKC